MNNYFKVVLPAILSIITTSIYAQSVIGTVRTSDSEPLVGASVWWVDTNIGAATDIEGEFKLYRVKEHSLLVASYLGYINDTIRVDNRVERVDFTLAADGVNLDEITVNSTIGGNFIRQGSIAKEETISFAGLCKMACCNLAESFENSASVTVGYSDAISGARQIKMLGLAGTYTQILDENRAIMSGIGAPYSLSYTPGMWLNSIQISKGVSSVTAGHEAITGQINLEHRKPTDEERLFLNLYLNDELRPEINASTAIPLTKDNRLSTVIMVHASADSDLVESDHNHDGFRDMPSTQQYNIANRWLYQSDSGVQIRWGVKLLSEERLGGMTNYEQANRQTMYEDNIYGSTISNRGANGYIKIGAPIGRALFDEESQSELRSNIALVADYDYFSEDAYFGLNDYLGDENSVRLNLMYSHYFTPRSSLTTGISSHIQHISESLDNQTPWNTQSPSTLYNLNRDESEVGIYAEYTYALADKLSVVAGVRGDYNSYYDNTLFTPRTLLKWSITESTTLRASAGMGHRTTNVITDNIGILATGRSIVIEGDFDSDFNRQERAATVGASLTQSFSLVRTNDAMISFDYFRTDFLSQVIVDQERDANSIYIYDSNGASSTDTFQLDFTWSPIERLDIFATYRHTDSSITLTQSDGSTTEVSRPLVDNFKTLLNVQYATPYRRWVFDATAQYNGSSRLPVQNGDITSSQYSPCYPIFFAQISRRVGQTEIYAGCENIADYRQSEPIIAADNPFSSEFNSSVVWGPLMGRKFYIGLRYNLF